MAMKKTVLDAGDVKKMAPWFKSDTIINGLLKWLNVARVNKLHGDNCHMQGADFTDGILRDLDIKLQIDGEEVLKNLPEGSFVVVSNHPFGALASCLSSVSAWRRVGFQRVVAVSCGRKRKKLINNTKKMTVTMLHL